MKFIALILLASPVWADTLTVKHGLFNYSLKMEKTGLSLQGKGLDLNFVKNDCNKRLLEKFERNLRRDLKAMTIFTQPGPESVEIKFSEQTSFQPRRSSTAKRFLSLPQEVKQLKLTEKLACSQL